MSSNGFVKKTCGVAKTVLKKTQELFEISQLNVKIMQRKNKIERKFVKIGYCMFNKQKKEGFESLKGEIENEEFKNMCEEINSLYKEIEKLECERDEIKRFVKKNKDCNKKCDCEENCEEKNTLREVEKVQEYEN